MVLYVLKWTGNNSALDWVVVENERGPGDLVDQIDNGTKTPFEDWYPMERFVDTPKVSFQVLSALDGAKEGMTGSLAEKYAGSFLTLGYWKPPRITQQDIDDMKDE